MTSKYKEKQQVIIKTATQLAAPVADRAIKGQPHRKMALRLAQRCYAYDNPQDSKSWGNLVSQKGVHRPGSYSK